MMECTIFDCKPSRKRMKELWTKFLVEKYGSEERVPEPIPDSDWDEFAESIEEEMREGIAKKMWFDFPQEERERLKKLIRIEWLSEEKKYFIGG